MTESSAGWPPRVGTSWWYATAAALVALYINMFALWRFLSECLGDQAGLIPFAATLSALAVLGAVAVRTTRSNRRTGWLVLGCAVAIAAMGLLVSDPDFPSKRIHVPQYIVLALVVRRGLSAHLSGWPLTLMGWLITVVLGCHDELVQGFHPQRTFGLIDLAANACGAAAGSLLAQAFGWIDHGRTSGTSRRPGARPPWTVVVATLCVLLGLMLELLALYSFRETTLPYWTMLPLLGGVVAWTCADVEATYDAGWRHALGIAVLLSALAAVYPVVSHVAPLVFS